jgi:hypothetical protein
MVKDGYRVRSSASRKVLAPSRKPAARVAAEPGLQPLDEVLALQRSAGNAYVARLVASANASSLQRTPEHATLRPGPMAIARGRRGAKAVPEYPVPEPKDDKARLLEQVGPSCWLFVVEAIANTRGLDTRTLSAVLYLHPAGAEAEHLHRGGETLDAIDARLVSVGTAINPMAHHYAWGRLHKAAMRVLPTVSVKAMETFVIRLLTSAPHETEGYPVGVIRDRLGEARALVAKLRVEMEKPGQAGLDEETKLLGGTWTQVGSDIEDKYLSDTIEGIFANSGGVAMMGVAKRFKPEHYKDNPAVTTDRQTYDFTKIPAAEIKEGEPHAVLLFGYSASSKTVNYRDPHHGNAVITITYDQVRKMAELWDNKVELYGMPDQSAGKGIRSILKPKGR